MKIKENEKLQKTRDLAKIRAEIHKNENDIRNLNEEVKILKEYKSFVKLIENHTRNNDSLQNKAKQTDDNIDVSDVDKDEQEDPEDDPEDDLFITKERNTGGSGSGYGNKDNGNQENLMEFEMTKEEKKDKILRSFESVREFMDILRKIEEENLFIIQTTQDSEQDLKMVVLK